MSRPFWSASLILACMLAGCGGPGPHGGTQDSQDGDALRSTSDKGILLGLVVDDAIRPIPGAVVRVTPTGGTAQENTTDLDGRFAFGDLDPGAYVGEVAAKGFFSLQFVATVQADVDEPDLVRVQLSADPGNTPRLVIIKDSGFFQVCAYYCASYVDLILQGNICNPTGVCPGPLFKDANLYFHPNVEDPVPGWIQSEAFWTPTVPQFPRLTMAHNYQTDGELPTRGSFGSAAEPNKVFGESPLVIATTPEMILAEPDQSPPDTGLGFDPERWGLSLFLYPDSDYMGAAVAYNQGFDVFTHYFYNAQPPTGWRFSADLDPELVPWP